MSEENDENNENNEIVENEENNENEMVENEENNEAGENEENNEEVENQDNNEIIENEENNEGIENQENNEIVENEEKPEEKEEEKEEEKVEIKKVDKKEEKEDKDEDQEDKDEIKSQEDDDEEEKENENVEEITFISRFFMGPDELYRKERYLMTIMRLSIFERILRVFLFQSTSKELSLYPFLDTVKKDPKQLKLFDMTLNYISEHFTEDYPLMFFNEVVKEINRVNKIGDLANMKFDKYILKLEFLLAWHFENNFLTKQIDNQLGIGYYDTAQIIKGKTNYIYSVECLNTIFKFMYIFEKQSLSTRIENEFPLIHNLFCIEKVYYFYCDKLNREKIPSGNIVKYLLEQVQTRIENSKNSKANNYDNDNYYMMNLYLINQIVQLYPFYFHKKPELLEIVSGLKILKNYPYPVGSLCSEVMENTLNEIMFQGISVLNKLRQIYFLDILDKKINVLETKYFRYTIMAYSYEWEIRHKGAMNTEHPDGFNLVQFINRLKNKPRKFYQENLFLREIVLKLLISIIINSKEMYSDETFKKIYQAFMPNYKELYNETDINDKKKKKKDDDDDDEESEEEEEIERKIRKRKKKKVLVQKPSRIKSSLDKLLKIIDVGTDKSIEDFDKEINLIANKLISIGGDPLNIQNEENIDNILDNKGFLPISSLRNYLKPDFSEKKIIYKIGMEGKGAFDIFGTYNKVFSYVVKKYFSYFLIDEIEDNLVEKNLELLRQNFYNNFRINILLFEEKGTMNDLLDNIQKKLSPEEIAKKVSDENFNNLWRFFVDDRKDIKPKFLIHIIPHVESDTKNPFRILSSEDKIDLDYTLISEYIAIHDYIYKNIIFMPAASSCDPAFYEYIPNCQTTNQNVLQFPSVDTMYSFIKKPIDYYIGNSNGIFNLDIYKITVNGTNEKLFCKNAQLFLSTYQGYESNCKITMQCVDYLGLEAKDEKVIEIKSSFIINIFNLFFKKNVPFNYNMNSNNGWLEVFLDDKYDKNIDDKLCSYDNLIDTNNSTKFYEEFIVPETNIETRFKNFKIKKFTFETNSANILVKYDDDLVYNYSTFKTQTTKKNEFNTKIVIEPYMKDEKKFTLPIATFTTI